MLQSRKRWQHAVVAATGLSTGRLTREQSLFLMAHTDVWGVNQVFLHHDLVPAFYNLEMRKLPDQRKKGRSVTNEAMWDLFDHAKRTAYSNTVFLTREEHAADVRKVLQRAAPCPRTLVAYKVKNAQSTCTATLSRNKLRQPTMSPSAGIVREFCGSSLSRVFDLMIRMRYSTISLVGVDLNSQQHFYTGLPGYASVAERLPQNWEASMVAFVRRANRNTTLHATAARGIHHFISAVGRTYEGRLSLFNLSPDSMLRSVAYIKTAPMPETAGEAALKGWWKQHQLGALDAHRRYGRSRRYRRLFGRTVSDALGVVPAATE